MPFYVFPPEIRRVVYTTNAIESLNMQLRKIIKTRGHFPNDEAAIKLLWLALRNAGQDRAVRLRLEIGDEPVCYPVRRAIYAGARITCCSTASPTKMRQVPTRLCATTCPKAFTVIPVLAHHVDHRLEQRSFSCASRNCVSNSLMRCSGVSGFESCFGMVEPDRARPDGSTQSCKPCLRNHTSTVERPWMP